LGQGKLLGVVVYHSHVLVEPGIWQIGLFLHEFGTPRWI